MKNENGGSQFKNLQGGVFQHKVNGNFYHRPKINGRRTWRVLAASTLAKARIVKGDWDRQALDAESGLARHPGEKPLLKTVGDVLDYWVKKGCPGRDRKPREGEKLAFYTRKTEILKGFWGSRECGSVRPALFSAYKDWRMKHGKREFKNCAGLEIDCNNLLFAFKTALRDERILANPMDGMERESLSDATDDNIRHCRECRPVDADELHDIARTMMETESKCIVLGFQMLVEAFSGCRTSEVLRFRWDAKPGQAGYIDTGVDGEQYLHLQRCKKGILPWVKIHPALKDCIAALKFWHEKRWPGNPWWFPSTMKNGAEPVSRQSLVIHLGRMFEKGLIKRRVISHAMRSYYVTVRRSQMVPDAVIAAEIGDKMGAEIIAKTYGDLPPNWVSTTLGKLTFLPENGKPAWDYIYNLPKREWTIMRLLRERREARKAGLRRTAWVRSKKPENVVELPLQKRAAAAASGDAATA